MKLHSPFTALAVMTLALSGCSSSGTLAPRSPAQGVACSTVSVNGTVLTIDAHLNRDFMPPLPVGGKPLVMVIDVSSAQSTKLPPDLSVASATVSNHDSKWVSTPSVITGTDPTHLTVVASNGPTWDPGATVEVDIVLLVQGRKVPVMLPNQRVTSTY